MLPSGSDTGCERTGGTNNVAWHAPKASLNGAQRANWMSVEAPDKVHARHVRIYSDARTNSPGKGGVTLPIAARCYPMAALE